MSERYIKVEPVVETVESGTSTALVALIVTIIAAVIIGLAVWQPWAAYPAPSNSTTIIRDKETKVQTPSTSTTPIIIQQPAQKAPDTHVTIHNDVTPPPDTKKSDQSNGASDTNADDNNGE